MSLFPGLDFPQRAPPFRGKSGLSMFHMTQLGIPLVPWPALRRGTVQMGASCSSCGAAMWGGAGERVHQPLVWKVQGSRGFGSGTGDRLRIPAPWLRFLICKVRISVDPYPGGLMRIKGFICIKSLVHSMKSFILLKHSWFMMLC